MLRKYPERKPTAVLDDLVAQTPGDQGKWFAAETNPTFALEAGLTALRWLAQGKGFEITALDVRNAYTFTMHAAALPGRADNVRRVIREYVAQGTLSDFMTNSLGPELDPS